MKLAAPDYDAQLVMAEAFEAVVAGIVERSAAHCGWLTAGLDAEA